MTIGKQLYRSFGTILGILLVLLVVDLAHNLQGRSASTEAASTLESVRTAEGGALPDHAEPPEPE